MADPWRNLSVHQFPGGEFHELHHWWNTGASDEHEMLEKVADSDSVTGGYNRTYDHAATAPLPKLSTKAQLNGEWRN